ncbi:RagB/SusD family nutrient uptake outer membrane protein [Mucilaginibacter aquatilis]|uniref:RagB/SusD family nutrient uptake outer membrane protein n=1 Tax=Mucilaginibacter aquatilis TaxID=1517760 RepID=A0A6I4IC63_9SPHI|nr:RagB/SusD family nutrient uptake outer membrane protein [Mucilaginibacter aquatilis]MVN92722.1 RagB/SusD family nutrient uptake outer membrane protein [Mucilaginibacter aquatilis]
MKRNLSFTFIIAAFCTLGCNKQLNTIPKDFISPVNYYQTEGQLNNALNGVYDPLGLESMYANGLLTYLSYGNDEGVWRASGQVTGPMVYNYDPSEANINNLWTAAYTGIGRANLLLDNIDKATAVATATRDVILAQALFLRAYYYFVLADNWGGVPLRLTAAQSAEDVDLPATPVADVYKQVVKDMETAEALLPTAEQWGPNSGGRVSKNTAAGILARVYLTMAGSPVNDKARYADALKWSKKVIDMGFNQLNADYSQVFINHCQDKYDVKESMWEVEFYGVKADAYNEVGYVGNRNGIASNNIDFPGYGYAFLYATSKLYKSYESRINATTKVEFSPDERRDWVVSPYTWNDATKTKTFLAVTATYDRFPGKWRRDLETNLPRNKNYSGVNFPLLRYSDVLLMFAEAENEINGPTVAALNALNQVRRRAYGKLKAGATNVTEADLTGLDKTTFFNAINAERMRELAFECLRNHDLKRWGLLQSTLKEFAADIKLNAPANRKFTAIIGDNIQDRHLFYPIPSREISLNKAIKQNQGW